MRNILSYHDFLGFGDSERMYKAFYLRYSQLAISGFEAENEVEGNGYSRLDVAMYPGGEGVRNYAPRLS